MTAVKSKASTFEINIPLTAFSELFEPEAEAPKFAKKLDFEKPVKVEMDFYTDEQNGGFIFTISMPNIDIATKIEEDGESKIKFADSRAEGYLNRLVKEMLNNTAYLIIKRNKGFYFDVVTPEEV